MQIGHVSRPIASGCGPDIGIVIAAEIAVVVNTLMAAVGPRCVVVCTRS